MSGQRAIGRVVFTVVVTAVSVIAAGRAAGQGADSEGFKPIFNGKDLERWSAPDMSYWSVEDGAITAESTAEHPATANQFLVWRGGTIDDFELKLRFKITGTDAANSGVQIRSGILDDGHVIGYQADIDRSGEWVGALYDEHGRAMLARRGQEAVIGADGTIERKDAADAGQLFAKVNRDEWNEYHITAVGDTITLAINGVVMSKVVDGQESEREMSGLLAVQLHSGPPMKVQFKDIRLKRLPLSDGRKKAVLVAGAPSHGWFAHEHNAGVLLLAERLNAARAGVLAVTYLNGYPDDPTAFDNADTVLVYCDGGGGHFLNDHLDSFGALMNRGVGLACIHYGVEVPKGEPGNRFLDWIGGYFETDWSVNPHWTAKFESLPEHPITRGVKPFEVNDEWYYHMRFREGMEGVTAILTDVPGPQTLTRPDGPHSGNPHVRAAVERGEPQHVAWAYERPNGGRGFGFTGAHNHVNWANDQFRKLVLNAIVWTAKGEVPAGGVEGPGVTLEDLEKNQDYSPPRNWDERRGQMERLIESWKAQAN